MPQDTLSFMQRVQEYGLLGYGWILLISFWGGTARYLSMLDGKRPTFLGWFSDALISGFVGIVVATTCQYYRLDFLITSSITGICAHNGVRSLYLVGEFLKKKSIAISVMSEPACPAAILARRKDKGNGNK